MKIPSEKKRLADIKKISWDRAIRVMILRNQGLTFERIGQELGVTKQRTKVIYDRFADKTVEELEELQRLCERTV